MSRKNIVLTVILTIVIMAGILVFAYRDKIFDKELPIRDYPDDFPFRYSRVIPEIETITRI